MESNQYFSVFILSVCAIHLAVTIGVRLQSWWQAFVAGRHRSQRPVQTDRGVGLLATANKQQRGDWYVFFHCTDLVGKEPSPKSDFPSSRKSLLPPLKKAGSSRRHQETRLTLTRS
jgi:hypothetical protein